MAVHKRFFFCGGVKARMRGYHKERFFNIAAQRKLMVCEISEETKEEGITFWTTIKDFKRMKPVARKAGVRLRIGGKYGLPFFLYRNRGRKLFAAGVVSFFLTLYALSFFIWDISFEGNHRFTDEMLLHYMETLPVACGMRKAEISCENLEWNIRNAFTEITWVSAEISGTRLTVRVKENEAVLTPPEKDDTPCDLTAVSGGEIVRTVVRSGICRVRAGDIVEEGQLLVDGTIPIYDDAETLVNSHEIHADAEIYARTTHTYEKRLPLTYEKRPRTGRKRLGGFVTVFGYSFHFLMPDLGDSSWEIVMEEHQLKLFEDFYLPVWGGVMTAYEYIPYESAYTDEEIQAEKDAYKKEYMENLTEKGIQMIGNDDRIEKDETGIRILGTVTVVEDIAREVPVPGGQEENQTANERN
ncbi:sporulation protein [bacterium 1XD42-94]|nr:sporulation protein [bacterium 1XD42-76]NBK04656.1 sporulation protein [bacterium 1XD42-94]